MALAMLSCSWGLSEQLSHPSLLPQVDGRAAEELVVPLLSILGNLMVLRKEVIHWQKRFSLVPFQAMGCKIRIAQVL